MRLIRAYLPNATSWYYAHVDVAAFIGAVFDAVPLLRWAWRSLLERQMEVQIQLTSEEYDVQYGENAIIFATIRLRLVNHRTDRKERITGACAALKTRFLWFWRRTIVTVPVTARVGPSLEDLLLEPQCSPVQLEAWIDGPTGNAKLERTMELWLVLDMVGPIRKLERKLTTVKHQPSSSSPTGSPADGDTEQG